MRNLLFIASLFFIFSCKKDKATHKESAPKDSLVIKKDSIQHSTKEDPINLIKKEYTILQAQLEDKKLSSSKFTYDCNDEPSGEVTFHTDQDGVKVIEHFYAEHSHFSGSEKYYIKDGKPFFIFRQETEWSFDGGTPESPLTRDDITETRIYLQNNKPLKCLEKKYSISSGRKEKTIPDNIPSKDIPCHTEELLKTYQLLLKHKDQKGAIQCL